VQKSGSVLDDIYRKDQLPETSSSFFPMTIDRTKLTEHRVKEQAVPALDVVRELGVEQLGLGRLLVALDQDLSYPDRAVYDSVSAAVKQSTQRRHWQPALPTSSSLCGVEGQLTGSILGDLPPWLRRPA
jgi:hypothetical protein